MARNFYNLEVWNLGYDLVLEMYRITEKFPEQEKNNITDQIRRASTSIPLNIAEGTSRYSKKAYLQFLSYALGSIRELEVLLLLSRDLKYITPEDFSFLFECIDKLSRKLFVFINKVNKEEFYYWYKN
jgi:four helix bundle protein